MTLHRNLTEAERTRLLEARAARDDAAERFAETVRELVRQNVSPLAIARAAGVSRARVYQIRDGKR